MAENRQFGSPQVSPGENQASDSAHCRHCETMLADALDGTLSPTDQAIFDVHMAHCGPCSQMLADARRGAAWLEMLRDPRPEPTTALLERIRRERCAQGREQGRMAGERGRGTKEVSSTEDDGGLVFFDGTKGVFAAGLSKNALEEGGGGLGPGRL